MNRTKLVSNSEKGFILVLSLFLFALASNSYADNIHATHNASEPKDCLDCHAGIHKREVPPNSSEQIADAHGIMLGKVPGKIKDDGTLDKKQCVFCHTAPVDLVQAAGSPVTTTANLRKRVDVRVCVLCHGNNADEVGEGGKFYEVAFADLIPQPDGAELYGLVCSGCHRQFANSEMEGKSQSKIQEAINKDKGGMGPLGVLNEDQVANIAVALGGQADGGGDSKDDEDSEDD